ncbi:hypothetical protein CWC31_01055 [Pseudoalteromonas ruthenica]|nr:hypothetical protein CWC31_01055 [Pseudoalteromonas ruthenica]
MLHKFIIYINRNQADYFSTKPLLTYRQQINLNTSFSLKSQRYNSLITQQSIYKNLILKNKRSILCEK